MKTYITKPSHLQPKWHVFDATEKTLGRLATEISSLLTGKRNPRFANNLVTGDYVVVVNAEKVRVTGKKESDKIYFRHTGYPGGGKEVNLSHLRRTNPERIIENAVKGMLPHNRLGARIMKHLKVYAGMDHPHIAQDPQVLEI